MSIEAIIFDLNGTVLSDEKIYGSAFLSVLSEYGIETDTDYPHKGGIGVEENWVLFKNKYDINESVENLARKTQDKYLSKITNVKLKPGFLDFVTFLKSKDVKLGLATSNTWQIWEGILNHTPELEGIFDVVTTAEEVGMKKPSPEIFILTADKLIVDPSDCIVVEDSASGIEAAKAAGMRVIGLYRDATHRLEIANADILVRNFTDLLEGSVKY